MMVFSSLCLKSCLLVLLCRSIEGLVTIAPPEIARVCRGHQLNLTCSVTGTHLEWSFYLIPENETVARRYSFAVTSLNTTDELARLQINSTTFMFSRSSAANSMPVVSRLTVDATTDALNGTEVTCSDIGTSDSASIIVHIINLIQEYHEVEGPFLSEYFEREIVTCTLRLELKQGSPHYSYNISVFPPPEIQVMLIESGTVNFTVFYNTHYNVSIHIVPPCGEYEVTTFVELYYAKCGDPAMQIEDSQVKVMGYNNPAVEGTNITLSCPSGLVLTGPNNMYIATCMENGKWEPDLGEMDCKATCGPPAPPPNGIIAPYSNTLEGAMVTCVCWTLSEAEHQPICKEMNITAVCSAEGNWEPNLETICAEQFDSFITIQHTPSTSYGLSQDGKIILTSSTVILVVLTLLAYSFGFLSGYVCQKVKKTVSSDYSDHELRPDQDSNNQLDLCTNIAYESVQQRLT